MLLQLSVLCAQVPCFTLCDASTLRLASMSEALAPGKQQTVTGDAKLTLQVMESPSTSMWSLALSAWAG